MGDCSNQVSNEGRGLKPFWGIFWVIIHSAAICKKTTEWYLMTAIIFNNIFCRKQDKQRI